MREDYLKADGEKQDANDKEFEKALRPLSFDDFTGQQKVTDNIKVFVQAAKQRSEPLDHVLLHGPPTHPLNPINPDNACHLRITAAAGT